MVPVHGSPRFVVEVEEGPPHGGLFELEIDTTYRVVDTTTGATVLTFHGEYSASFGDGDWKDGSSSGVIGVEISTDEREVIVTHAGGREERLPLPG